MANLLQMKILCKVCHKNPLGKGIGQQMDEGGYDQNYSWFLHFTSHLFVT